MRLLKSIREEPLLNIAIALLWVEMGLLIVFIASTLLIACTGKIGPTGPAGPQGAQGIPGLTGLPGPAGTNGISMTRLVVTGIANTNGGVVVTLPPTVGTNPLKPPSIAAYIVETPGATTNAGLWLSVGDGYSAVSPYWGIKFIDGAWTVVMVNVPVGWTAAFVVVF